MIVTPRTYHAKKPELITSRASRFIIGFAD
jgi:hypothetical protein